MSIDSGVLGLLANAKNRSTYQGEKYYFRGDLVQMSCAQKVAQDLGINTGCQGGIPFVMSREDFEKVSQHIINHKIDGWWHYVRREEYLKMKEK